MRVVVLQDKQTPVAECKEKPATNDNYAAVMSKDKTLHKTSCTWSRSKPKSPSRLRSTLPAHSGASGAQRINPEFCVFLD